ncbi:MAG: hypothetical protein JOZ80_03460 [Acidobacteriaceae bacterium]|nr:hypothetical protein [Acidobacteriaceae bacterium]
MATVAEETNDAEITQAKDADTVQALVQLLRGRSYEEIRQRMYDSPPGSNWWLACKTELDIRNGEQMASALSATSRVLERLRASTEHFEQLADTLYQTTTEIRDVIKGTQESSRRLEIAIYAAIGITLVQLFDLTFEIFRKR